MSKFDSMAAGDDITVLERSEISPNPGDSSVEKPIPLSFLDIPWLFFPPIHQLCFYELPQSSKSHFTKIIVPNLKHSLSITLQHYFPFAGNLIVFPFVHNSNTIPKKPEIRYLDGDSVSVTISECTKDFTYLTGNHVRKANEFHPLVPKLGIITRAPDAIKVPLLAIQVTLFPNRGICIGITSHHAACDFNALVSFIKAWASITKFGNDKPFLASGSLPFFDKSVLKDPHNRETSLWSFVAKTKIQESQPQHLTTSTDDKVRASFIMTRDQINRAKKSVIKGRPTLAHVSSFTIVCAHVWSSMAKLRQAVGFEDEEEMFGCLGDCRARLEPPLPASYFGNCIVGCDTIMVNRDHLVGEEGFLNAVELISDAIKERFSKEGINDALKMTYKTSIPKSMLSVAGSPKFNIYETDFGWGKPTKCEMVSIDYSGAMCLSACRDSKEDLEIGLSLAKVEMDVFETIFSNELKKICFQCSPEGEKVV